MKDFSIPKTALNNGILTSIGLIAYFLLMKLAGLLHIIELRGFNFFILGAGIWFTMKSYRHEHYGPIDYLEGFGLGLLTSVIAGLAFSVFLFIYLSILDTGFMEYLKVNAPFGSELSPMASAFAIMIEASASGAVVTLLSLQYFRKARHLHHGQDTSHNLTY